MSRMRRLNVTKSTSQRRSAFEMLEDRRLLTVVPELFLDVNTAPEVTIAAPHDLTSAGGVVFFAGADLASGFELWKSDGTALGTTRVKDIFPGVNTSELDNLTNVGGVLYFTANDGVHGTELWKSDGTDAGTVLVKDIRTGTASTPITSLTAADGRLYFVADNGATGTELWTSDGSAAGTYLVKDIVAGPTSSEVGSLTAVGSAVFFHAVTPASGAELWRSDGTEAGTAQVREIHPSIWGSLDAGMQMVNVNGVLYFYANDGVRGRELWRSDGTEAGTIPIEDSRPGIPDSRPYGLTNVNGTLFFGAFDGVSHALFRTDGAPGNAVKVSTMNPGGNFTAVGNKLFFSDNDSQTGSELWVSDGTAAGTKLVKDINTAPSLATLTASSDPAELIDVNGVLYFVATDATWGRVLYRSDGTEAGTFPADGTAPPPNWPPEFPFPGSEPVTRSLSYLAVMGGSLYYSGVSRANPSGGYGLWKKEATGPSTLVKAAEAGTMSADVTSMLVIGDVMYFALKKGTSGPELWRTDGTVAGTMKLKSFSLSPTATGPELLTNVNGMLYFTAWDGPTSGGLWKSDGTVAGTVKLIGQMAPRQLTAFNDKLIFTRINPSNLTAELWTSDGTAAGTQMLAAASGQWNWNFQHLTVVGNSIYYGNYDELWKSDGTSAGTMLVKDFAMGGNSRPSGLTNLNNMLYFTHGLDGDLWRSDGTEGGTVRVKEFPQFQNINGNEVVNVGGILYFPAGENLWRSDGTTAGTVLVGDVTSDSSSPRELRNVDGTFYFWARTDVGTVLHTSDGTLAGTRVVTTLSSLGSSTEAPSDFVSAGGNLYFYRGSSIGRTDGTPEGSSVVKDVSPYRFAFPVDNFVVNSAVNYTEFKGSLYFTVNDVIHGNELWVIRPETRTGDYNGDGIVNGTDFLAWQRGLGAPVTPSGGGADGDGSGHVDAGDLGVWRASVFAANSAASAAAVVASDEPAAPAATLDAVYSAGDFTSLFQRGSYRPAKRVRAAR